MALLEAHALNVRFGEHQAVRDVTLEVEAGTIVGLIGPNGAGKTTTFNALSGVQACTGRVLLDGTDVSGAPAHRRARLGMNRTFQRLEVFGSMTAFDNIRTAAEISARAHRRSMRGAAAVAHGIVEQLDLGRIADRRADALPTGQARLVELGRALATAPKVVLLVEHDMDLVMQLCSTIFVLDLGAVIATGTPAEVRADPAVAEAYLGAVV
jgi:branched-chain amino acid transport system ATP-binding protein